jgi:spore maturation protein CgeB
LDELLEQLVADLAVAGPATAFWDVDAPATLDRMLGNPTDPLRPWISRYDLVLTYGGGQPVVRAYESLGARQCVPIYNGLDPETHFPVEPDETLWCDLAFLGNALPDRNDRVREFFLKPAAALQRRSFLLGGNGWRTVPVPPNVRRLGHVPTARHNALNSSALAVLNICRASMARYGFSPATRVFEAAGAGACVITDDWEGIEEFFTPEREILVVKNGTELIETLRSLAPEKAKRIGQAARKRALGEHTYESRARQLEKILANQAVP